MTTLRRWGKTIAQKYQVEAIYLFGSYARGEADEESDLDFLVFGGLSFKRILVLDIAEELRIIFQKDVDAFEISEVNTDSEFYRRVMQEKVLISQQSSVSGARQGAVPSSASHAKLTHSNLYLHFPMLCRL